MIKRCNLVAAAVILLCATAAHAVGKASSPNISEGELEIEYEAVGLVDGDDRKREFAQELEVSYGVNDWFRPEIAIEHTNPANGDAVIDTLGVGAQFIFIQPGTHWFDSAIRVIYEHKPHDDADVLLAKLLLQKEYGNYQHRANINMEQQLGDDAQAGGPEWSLVWSSRYAITPGVSAGFEYDGEFGQSRDFDRYEEQAHYVGPVIYADLSDDLELEAGYLFGISDEAADGALRFSIEYGIDF